jgi:hypothetical protein
MRKQILALAAAALLAGCASAASSSGTAGDRGPRPGAFNPVTVLIEARDTLGLVDMQVDALRGIAAELQRKNQPLMTRMEPRAGRQPGAGGGRGPGGGGGGGGMGGRGGMGGGGGAGGGGGRGRPGAAGERAAMDSVRRQIEANNADALAKVDAVLTPDQRVTAAAYLERHRPVPRTRPSRPAAGSAPSR